MTCRAVSVHVKVQQSSWPRGARGNLAMLAALPALVHGDPEPVLALLAEVDHPFGRRRLGSSFTHQAMQGETQSVDNLHSRFQENAFDMH